MQNPSKGSYDFCNSVDSFSG